MLSTVSSHGRPVQIASPVQDPDGEDARFKFNANFINEIQAAHRLQNSKVAVISVAGAFRKGKSFLLNFFLRYLRAQRNGDTSNWIHSTDELSDGFHWRSGSERDTAGILIWSEPFFIPMPNGEEVAVLLMDTQGTFDHQSTQQDCTTIFAFSTLLSSVQIFNISQNLQETDLQHLRLFVEFAAMAKETKEPVLQHLWFLIRDWQYPDEHDFGVDGGRAYLNKVLACDSKKPRENQELRQGIRRHFKQVSCCLFPYPGKAVRESRFRGEAARLDPSFLAELQSFIPRIVSKWCIAPKMINGNELSGKELFGFFEVYFEAFCNGKVCIPRSAFTAMVDVANLSAAKEAKQFFENSALNFIDADELEDEFHNVLVAIDEQALEQFDAKCMEKNSSDTVRARQVLQTELKELQSRQMTFKQLRSEKTSADRKHALLAGEITSLQEENLAGMQRLQQMEEDFKRSVDDIKRRSISREEMQKLLQEESVKHATARKRQESRSSELYHRLQELAAANEELQDGLSQNQREFERQLSANRRRFEEEMRESESRLREADRDRGSSSLCIIM